MIITWRKLAIWIAGGLASWGALVGLVWFAWKAAQWWMLK